MINKEDIDGLKAVGLNPRIIDESTNFDDLNLPEVFREEDFPIEFDAKGKAKTNSRRNVVAGHIWEREIVNRLKAAGFRVGTSRLLSRDRDNKKVDMVGTHEREDGYFPVNIQAKTLATRSINFPGFLAEMPKENVPNVIAFRQTNKAQKNFMKQGDYAIMYFDSFLYYLDIEKKYKELLKEYQRLGHAYNKVEESLEKYQLNCGAES